MSHSNQFKFTRRTMLAGTATGLAVAALPLGIASANAPKAPFVAGTCSSSVCVDHHRELSHHLRHVLNASYVDDHTKNTMLRTTTCPHCQVGIHPAEQPKPQFTALAA